MSEGELKKLFQIEDILSLPNAIFKIIFDNDERLHHIYRELLQLNTHDLSRDWFQDIYEGELAQRNQNKQDFTPKCLSTLVSKLLGSDTGVTYEPTAGTGGMLISNWYNHRNAISFIDYKPNDHLIVCGELSDKTVPFLLFNLSIRGISGIVFHGDTLRNEYKAVYILTNRFNSPCDFSTITKWK